MLEQFIDKVKRGLEKTRSALSEGISSVIGGTDRLNDEMVDEIEAILLQADVGLETTTEIVEELRENLQDSAEDLTAQVMSLLKEQLTRQISDESEGDTSHLVLGKPHVILIVGVNGVGKTTTVGKLAKQFSDDGKRVLLAACDTFRAAAIPQLEVWSQRAGADIIQPQQAADPASVAFDALSAALARDVDVLLVDTAGRLHNKVNLMEELKKIRRSLGKQDPGAPHETLLVLDATTGQNALNQAREFNRATELTGLVLTKLDGTAKGGIAFALRREFGLPVKLIGVGEGVDDLQPFNGHAFVEALFEE